MRKINLIITIICICLYAANVFVFKKTDNKIQPFFICWFNDLLAPVFVLSYINYRFGELYNFHSLIRVLLLCTTFTVIWEFAGYIIKQNSVFDPVDIACYYIGGTAYYIIIKIYNAIKKRCH